MKKITLLLLIIMLFSCKEASIIKDIITEPPIDDPRLIANWHSGTDAWTFREDNTFRYFNRDTEEDQNVGIYNADPIAGTIYLEDINTGANQTYIYDVLADIPTEGEYTLRWATPANPLLTKDWLRY